VKETSGFGASSARYSLPVGFTKLLDAWPVVRQLRAGDMLGTGKSAQSSRSQALRPRIEDADKVSHSICPFCAVGCAQLVYVKDGEVSHVASPISRGRLCPKGSATKSLHTSPVRETKVKYRRPYSTEWEELSLETAMEMIADRMLEARDSDWDAENRRTLALANLGGATLDNEENYLIKKLCTALGVIQVENQARI
jgi:formate dehydrogenase major subunit